MPKKSKKRKKKNKSKKKPQIIWRPISYLATVAHIIDGQTEGTEEQYHLFLEGLEKPHVLDDAIVNRALRLYNSQLEDIQIFGEQISRWEKLEDLSETQRVELERLAMQLVKCEKLTKAVLELLDEIKKGTIDRILEKDDMELGMDLLSGKLKPPKGMEKIYEGIKKEMGVDSTMNFTEEQIRIVEKIDKFVQDIVLKGGGEEEILKNMHPYMNDFKDLMTAVGEEGLNTLAFKYHGFFRFSMLLSGLAEAIGDGSIEVPPEM